VSADWSGLASSLSRLGEQHKQKANFDLQTNTSAILQDVKKLQDRRSSLQEGDPQIKEIDDSLANHQRVMTDLLAHHKVSPEEIAGLFSSAAGTAPKDPYLTPDELKKKARIAAGLDPRAVEQKPEAENWVPTPITLSDGRQLTAQRNSKSGAWTDLAGKPIPPELLSTATIPPKEGAGGHSKFNEEAAVYEKKWGKKLADWSPEQLSFFNQKMAFDAARSGTATSTKLVIDQNNQVIPVTVTNQHGPTAAPVEDPSWTPGASVPKTPGEAKKKVAAVAPKGGGGVHVGAPLPITAKNPVEQAAHKTYIAAYQLADKADEIAKNPTDALNQKRLAVALERVAAGRFTTQALDFIVRAGWQAGAEQFWNNIDNGTLPAVVVQNLIKGAHEERDSAYKAWQEARKPSDTQGGDDDDKFLKNIK
jgi:hypothetical protein